MGRRLLLGLTLLALLALAAGTSVNDRELNGVQSTEVAPPKPPAKAAVKAPLRRVFAQGKKVAKIARAAVEKGRQLSRAARAVVRKQIDSVKQYLKKKWTDVKQIYQYTRYCLNHKAPKKLKLKLPNSAICATVKKAHPVFASAIEKIASFVPQPTLPQTLAAEIAGERTVPRRHHANSSAAFIETGAGNPGNPGWKWPSSVIPYGVSPDLDPAALVNFQWAINHVESLTCVRFEQVEFNATSDGIQVIPDNTKCASIVGYLGSPQNLWWGPDCAAGSGAHELLHALGFDHTQNRLDRDLYIQVESSLIEPGNENNFKKRESPFQNYGPYDFMSILHYPNTAFSVKEEEPIIVEIVDRPSSTPAALNSPWNGDAQRDSLTEGDIAAVTAIYCK